MKIVVAVKQVPDTATQVKISGADPKAIDTAGITWIVSPYDEFAIEEALRIKEKRGQGEVVAVSLGPDRVKEALRSALAMGCCSIASGSVVVVIVTRLVPGGSVLSPDSALAVCAFTMSMSAPMSSPSVPALTRPLEAVR